MKSAEFSGGLALATREVFAIQTRTTRSGSPPSGRIAEFCVSEWRAVRAGSGASMEQRPDRPDFGRALELMFDWR